MQCFENFGGANAPNARRSKSGYICWSNNAFFQGITSLKAVYIINSENVWNGPKQRASFFTNYTYLVYLQNARYKSMLHTSVCHCFSHPQGNQWRTVTETHSRPG